MSLSTITLGDRKRLIEALELPYSELEEGSSLYLALLELENRDERLGADLISDLLSALTDIEAISAMIDYSSTTESSFFDSNSSPSGKYSLEIIGEIKKSVDSGSGDVILNGKHYPLGSPILFWEQERLKLRRKISRILDLYRKDTSCYPTVDGNSLILG